MTYTKSQSFDTELQDVARFSKVMAHPARLAILQHLAKCCSCKSGDIAEVLPLSRTTVSQHLQELKSLNLLNTNVDGKKINYEINEEEFYKFKSMMDNFFNQTIHDMSCSCEINNLFKEKQKQVQTV